MEPVAKSEMLIRRPVADVFEAFIDPAITSRFWFTKAVDDSRQGKRFSGIGKCITFPYRSE